VQCRTWEAHRTRQESQRPLYHERRSPVQDGLLSPVQDGLLFQEPPVGDGEEGLLYEDPPAEWCTGDLSSADSSTSLTTESPTSDSDSFAGRVDPPTSGSSESSSSEADESSDDDVDVLEDLQELVFVGARRTVAQVIYDVFGEAQSQKLPLSAVKADFARMRRTFPVGHKLPTFARARKLLLGFASMTKVVYEMCSAGCVLYRDVPRGHDPDQAHQYSSCTHCPTCGLTRQGNTTVYTHVPLRPQLAGLHADPVWRAAIERGDLLRGRREDEYMRSIHDSPAYADFYQANPTMQGVVLGALSTDGVNPFKGVKYSMWPFMWKILNYPPHLASRTDLMLLVGVVHGPRSPKSIQPVLKLIVEDLIELWNGVPVGDLSEEGVLLTIRACLFLVIGDYPALSKLRLQQEGGSLCGCMFCNLRGESVPVLNTVVYSAGPRMLPLGDPDRGPDRTPPPTSQQPQTFYRTVLP